MAKDKEPDIKKKDTFSAKYDRNWQTSLVSLLVQDPLFAEQFSEVVDLRLFEERAASICVRYLYEFRKRYGEYPTPQLFSSAISYFSKKDSEKESFSSFIQDLRLHIPVKNPQFIKDTAISFCKNRKMANVLLEVAELAKYELSDNDFEEVLKKVESVVHSGINYDRGHFYKDNLFLRYSDVARIPVSTGIPKLDEIMSGGLGKGELGLVVGGTGSGKSMFLVWLATQAAKRGYNVIYYTMELSETEIGKRIDSCITGLPLNAISSCQDAIQEEIKKMEGSILIKAYPMKQCSIQTIRSHITKEITLSYKPDMILIDYVDTMQFTSRYTELRHNLQTVMEELRGLAKEFNIVVWTASQTNREGYSNTNPGLEHISEAFSKTFSTDFTLTIGRTDKEKRNGEAVYKIAKNRNGIDGISFFGKMDTLRVQISFESEYGGKEIQERGKVEETENIKKIVDLFFDS